MKPGDLVRLGKSAGGHLRGEMGMLLVIHNNPGDETLPETWRWCDVLVNGVVENDLFLNDLKPIKLDEGNKHV